MSNHKNHRRGEDARTEHGPTWENPDPGAGCNATHVARGRRDWRTLGRRAERRTGRLVPKVMHFSRGPAVPPAPVEPDEMEE